MGQNGIETNCLKIRNFTYSNSVYTNFQCPQFKPKKFGKLSNGTIGIKTWIVKRNNIC